jgi:peroxiredoxin Q/BCP
MKLAPLVALALFASAAAAADLEAGVAAPPFALPGSDGRTHALADHVGKRGVVLAWFPKAFTPG